MSPRELDSEPGAERWSTQPSSIGPGPGTLAANRERRPEGTLEALGALARWGAYRSFGQRRLASAQRAGAREPALGRRNPADVRGLSDLIRSLRGLIRNPCAADSGDGLIRSLPIIFEVAAPFERVAPRILPTNWGTCISALHTVVHEWLPTPRGWTGSVEERVTLGPAGIRTISSLLHVDVVENHAGRPSEHSTQVDYRLGEVNESLLRDEGKLAVYRHAQLEESHSVVIVEKTLQFRDPFDALVLNGTGLRAVLQIWLAAAADDECWGSQWRSAVATALPGPLDGAASAPHDPG